MVSRIYECSGVDLSEQDDLPQTVCKNCVKRIEEVEDFRKRCKLAQDELKSMFMENTLELKIQLRNPEDTQENIIETKQDKSRISDIKENLKEEHIKDLTQPSHIFQECLNEFNNLYESSTPSNDDINVVDRNCLKLQMINSTSN